MRVVLGTAPGPPTIVAGYRRHIRQREGTTIRVQCPVRSEPTALVSWYKDHHEINIAWQRYRIGVVSAGGAASADTLRVNEVSQLRVRNATRTDSGIYVCTATNGFGSVRASFQVLVYRTSCRTVTCHHHRLSSW